MKKNAPIIIILAVAVLFCALLFAFSASSNNEEEPPKQPVTESTDNIHKDASSGFVQAIEACSKTEFVHDERINYEKVSFVAFGDNIIHSSVYEDAKLRAAGSEQVYNFLPMYDHVKDIIKDADIAFVNQETLLAGTQFAYQGYPTFNSPDEVGDALIALGFDIVNIANNHMVDKSERGLKRAIEHWEDKDEILLIGGYKNEEDFENIRIYEKNGISIAWLSYTYGTNGLNLPSSSELIIPLYDKETVDRQTKLARNCGADLVFVSMHWGLEDNFLPNSYQKELAEIMAQNCVDVVIGHHPHVIQPIEWKQRPDGKQTLVIYSLGNMLSTMLYTRNMLGGYVSFDIIKFPNTSPTIDNVVFTPIITYYNSVRRGCCVYPLSEFTPELARSHGANANDSNMSISFFNSLLKRYMPEEFLAK